MFQINDFHVFITRAGKGYDFHVKLNGQQRMIGFANRLSPAAGGGYNFVPLSISQFPVGLRSSADALAWYEGDAKAADGGLSLSEVRERAHVLAGIYLAGQASK